MLIVRFVLQRKSNKKQRHRKKRLTTNAKSGYYDWVAVIFIKERFNLSTTELGNLFATVNVKKKLTLGDICTEMLLEPLRGDICNFQPPPRWKY